MMARLTHGASVEVCSAGARGTSRHASPSLRGVVRLAAALLLAAAFALAAAVAAPAPALAKSYEMTRTVIWGEAKANGDFTVTEARTYDFEGTYHNAYWTIPTSNAVDVVVESMAELDEEGRVVQALALAEGGEEPGTYTVERSSRSIKAGAHFEKTDTSAIFAVQYTVKGAVKAWADTGEVNWQAIGPGWDQSSNDVHVFLKLPVPEGEQVVLGDNVRAWVDGPLDGTVGLNERTGAVVMECPRVQPGQYLSVLCAFPVEWLPETTPSAERRLDAIMAMGADAAQRANAERERARAELEHAAEVAEKVDLESLVLSVMASLAGLGVVFSKFRKHGREHPAVFDDKYWRDVPSDDHPAVIGSLWRWGATKPEDLTATLMRLTDEGAIKLERVQRMEKGLLGQKLVEDYRLSRIPAVADALEDPIDRKAMKLVFDTVRVGRGEMSDKELAQIEGRELVDEFDSPLGDLKKEKNAFLFSDFAKFAKADAGRYKDRYDSWKQEIDKQAQKRSFYEDEGEEWKGKATGIGVLLILVGMGVAVLHWLFVGSLRPVAVVAPIAAGVVCLWMARLMRRRSTEANEIAKKTEALRNWLKDFTNLGEAIPTDIVLWDKLLVLSVVLGVSERVIEQLKAAAPQILEADGMAGAYYWCLPWGNAEPPGSTFSQGVASAQALSNAALAASTMSDVGGGGGGFGGGGFGGSFGGGSFGGGGGGAS